MAFSWTRAGVQFDSRLRLVYKSGVRIAASELPEISGGWMRLAALQPALDRPAAIVGFASAYGFLRHERETFEDWYQAIETFGAMAAPWGEPGDPHCQAMPAPGPAANALLKATRVHAEIFGTRAFDEDLRHEIGDGPSWQPATLVGLLFLQALDARRELPSFRRCLFCSGWFAAGRADQVYCLPKHRSLHHYHERKR